MNYSVWSWWLRARNIDGAPKSGTFRPDIQGLRAVAVGAVLLYHAGFPRVTGGFAGVDIFFVISGYLITGGLLAALVNDGRIRFGAFYARRIRRILPASLVVAVCTAIAVIVFYPPLAVEKALRDAWATVLYVPNIWFATQQTDYLADQSPSAFQHYWSLGVEEQFYLLWPLALMLIWWVSRRRRGLVLCAALILCVASLGLNLLQLPTNQPATFFLLPTRAWELLLGGVVAVVAGRFARSLPAWCAVVGGWLGMAMMALAVFCLSDATPYPGAAALVPSLGAALVIYCGGVPSRGGPSALLSIAPMQFLGRISYSLYLVHWPLLIVAQQGLGEQVAFGTRMKLLLGVVLAIPLAWLLYRFVERPAMSWRGLAVRPPRITLLVALGLSVVLAIGGAGAVWWASVRDIGTGPIVAAAPVPPVSPPTGHAFVPRNLTPPLTESRADLPVLYADGCQQTQQSAVVKADCVYGDRGASRRMAIFGDSHAAQWFPAVEAIARTRGDLEVTNYTKSSCPVVNVTVLFEDQPYAACDQWREAALARIIEEKPRLVLVSNYGDYQLAAQAGPVDENLETWAAGLGSVVETLEQAGITVLVMADTPELTSLPDECLSATPLDTSSCDVSRADGVDSARRDAERDATARSGGTFVDMNDYICSAAKCPLVIDNLMVYRDMHHLTATFSAYLAPILEKKLTAGLRACERGNSC